MNRLGLPGEELSRLAGEWKTRLKDLNLVLLMSHLACGDEIDNKMNDAAAFAFPHRARHAAARAGQPGGVGRRLSGQALPLRSGPAGHRALWRRLAGRRTNPCKTAAVLTARVLQLRRIDKGESVGYAATFRAKRPTMLATVALGYAGGIPRSLSNKGWPSLRRASARLSRAASRWT